MDAEVLLRDKDFLQSTLASLPGVDPNEVLQMMEQEQGEGVEEERDGHKDEKEGDSEQQWPWAHECTARLHTISRCVLHTLCIKAVLELIGM